MEPAVLTTAGVIIAGLLTVLSIIVGQLYARVSHLERNYRKLWAWGREILDLYYRHRKAGAPNPPPLPEEE